MGKLQVKQDVFNNMGVGAGLILKSAPAVDETTHVITISDSSILGATRGGITFNSNPQMRSRTVDGLAPNTVGAHVIDNYAPTVSATFITNEPDVLLKAVGFADYQLGEIIARHDVKSTDYVDLWIVESLTSGGAKITSLKNCLASGGSAIKTNDKGETEIPLTLEANYDLNDQDTPPFDFTIVPAPVEPTPEPTPEPSENAQQGEQQGGQE